MANFNSVAPKNLTNYIGQEEIKERLKNYIVGINEGLPIPNFTIYGNSGSGKTTLAKIICNETYKNYILLIGEEVNEMDKNKLKKTIYHCNNNILIIDEAHSIKREMAELCYPYLDNNVKDINISMIFCTTEIGILLKKVKPLFNRTISIALKEYSLLELETMCRFYKEKLYPNFPIKEEIYRILAENCRGNPRLLQTYLISLIYFKNNYKKMLASFGILGNGITKEDISLLKYISKHKEGCGINSICTFLDTAEENYLRYFEPWLLKSELIIRTTRGRKITEKGKLWVNNYE